MRPFPSVLFVCGLAPSVLAQWSPGQVGYNYASAPSASGALVDAQPQTAAVIVNSPQPTTLLIKQRAEPLTPKSYMIAFKGEGSVWLINIGYMAAHYPM